MSDKETEIRERLEKAERSELVGGFTELTSDIRYLLDENARLRAELAERDKDAERYRWFRTAMGTSDKRAQESAINALEFKIADPTTPEEIDACFDAAMTEDNKPGLPEWKYKCCGGMCYPFRCQAEPKP